jgi:CBS domain-containing protein
MKVSEVMSKQPEVVKASETVLDAAKLLKRKDVGMVPVEKDDRIIGVLTDRDIVMRVVAEDRSAAQTSVESVISKETKYCFDDEETDHVAKNMDQLLVRRLPVVNRDKRLVGMVSIEDIRPRKAA